MIQFLTYYFIIVFVDPMVVFIIIHVYKFIFFAQISVYSLHKVHSLPGQCVQSFLLTFSTCKNNKLPDKKLIE